MLRKTFRAIATLQQESFALRDAPQLLLQTARLTGEYQRWEGRKLFFDVSQRLPVRIIRHLLNRLLSPTIGCPAVGHYALLQHLAGVIHDSAPPLPVIPSVRLLRTRSEEHTSELQSHVNLVCR